jgi:hypothetical protein
VLAAEDIDPEHLTCSCCQRRRLPKVLALAPSAAASQTLLRGQHPDLVLLRLPIGTMPKAFMLNICGSLARRQGPSALTLPMQACACLCCRAAAVGPRRPLGRLGRCAGSLARSSSLVATCGR